MNQKLHLAVLAACIGQLFGSPPRAQATMFRDTPVAPLMVLSPSGGIMMGRTGKTEKIGR